MIQKMKFPKCRRVSNKIDPEVLSNELKNLMSAFGIKRPHG